MIHAQPIPGGFELRLGRHVLARHTPEAPFLSVGSGTARMAMYRGNFDITDDLHERVALEEAHVAGDSIAFSAPGGAPLVRLRCTGAALEVTDVAPGINRLWFRLEADPDAAIWGCGEQMSYFDLRGRRFPIWTSEPGVGRDKSTRITQMADEQGRAGGDYFTTNYPQPTFLTAHGVAVHLQSFHYSVCDFTNPRETVLEVWGVPDRLEFFAEPSLPALVSTLSTRFGRPPRLPDWAMAGAILGFKDGAASFDRLARVEAAGAAVTGLWCEDWAGIRTTSFGRRLFWDWQWNPARYPDLPGRIAALRARGIRFLGYANPYLCVDGALYPEALARGLLARNAAGGPYHVDFGEFDAGVVDFTNPAASDWFAARILRQNMLGLGLSGWMADFGEYLPIDAVLANGDARERHNAWPTLWAEVNARAVAGTDAVFFMRAGFTGIQPHNRLLWAGDQCVDFSRHDGIGTTICAALSAGLLGNPYHHSDIGGYTSLFGLTRTPELLMRWTELAAFTPVMRTHEGNRPDDNLQIDQDAAVLAHFARFTRIHRVLLPYLAAAADEAAATGLPMQRPLVLHFPDDPATHTVQDQFLLGPDLLVAPVIESGATSRRVVLPRGADWVHLPSGRSFAGGVIDVAAPIGAPAVFARAGSAWARLFHEALSQP